MVLVAQQPWIPCAARPDLSNHTLVAHIIKLFHIDVLLSASRASLVCYSQKYACHSQPGLYFTPYLFSAARFHCSLSRRLPWSLDSVAFLPKLDGMHVGNCIFHVCPSYALRALMSGQIRISVLGLCRPRQVQSPRAIACFSLRTSYVSFVFNDHGSRSIGGDASATSVSGWRLYQPWHWRYRRLRWCPAPAQFTARV